ncbi:hypothetical protein SNE40_017295 [Patella caerulea]|uniref:MACPF domain-containing protein n=1 Tax=Patella caerulea TaxID=87958 RepID=A0AAN8PFI2_PATCE
MHLLELALWMLVGHLVHGSNPGINFIGTGYNLLKANPEGGVGGGVDPGLNTVRNIFQLSKGNVPKEVKYSNRHSCSQQSNSHVYYGTKSYQSRLGIGITASGQANGAVEGAAFSLSAGYHRANSETNSAGNVIFDNETICNFGSARFTDELSFQHNLHVTTNFAAAVCVLPILYNEAKYMQFLDDWGTHVITKVDFGTKVIKRYKSSREEFFKHVQKSGGFGFSILGFLSVDFRTFKESEAYKLQFGTFEKTLTAGSTSYPQPVGLTIKTIAEALNYDYWWGPLVSMACGHSLTFLHSKQSNLVKALNGYAKFKLFTPPKDPQLLIPLTWPVGTYGLIATKSGCPAGGVTWHGGARHQDGYTFHRRTHYPVVYKTIPNKNAFSAHNHIGGTQGQDITLQFCMKGAKQTTGFDSIWPKGDYCILKYGDCPGGFQTGSILWDDENKDNHDSSTGSLPDGKYDTDTRIDFCCRNDAVPTGAISLPIDKPFILFRYTRACQQVKGMTVTEEFIRWDDYPIRNHDKNTEAHPFDDGGDHQHKLHFCYYAKSGSALIG